MQKVVFLSALSAFAVLALAGRTAGQQERLDLTGRVRDEKGAPLPGARVSIATAAVRKGMSPY